MENYTFMHSGKTVRSLKGHYIGASEIPIILGLTKTTVLDLWMQKTGRAEGFKGNELTYWGHMLEGLILHKHILKDSDGSTAHKFLIDYTRNMFDRSRSWKPKTEYHPFTECRHSDFPWMIAHADCVRQEKQITEDSYLTDPKFFNPSPRIIEAKSGSRFANLRREEMDGYDSKDPTQSGLPMKVYSQVQWQQAVYDIQDADVCALIDTNNFMRFHVPGNKQIQAKLTEIGSRFIRCLVKDIPPTPRTFGDIGKLFPEINNNRLTIMGEKSLVAWDIKERLKKSIKKKKKAKLQIDDCTNALGLLIGENKELADEWGEKICSQSKYESPTMISQKAIKENCPEVFETLVKAGLIKSHEVRRIY